MACDPDTLIEDAKCACDTNPVTGVIENLWCQIANNSPAGAAYEADDQGVRITTDDGSKIILNL